LGVRHAGYMVQDHHYGLVGEALLWTLREGLGDAFNPETESAWREVYGVVASVMKKAAASGVASKPPVSPPAPPPSAPPVPEDLPLMIAAPPIAAPPIAVPPITAHDAGDETMPYHLLAQTRVMGLPSYAQLPGNEELPPEARSPFAPPAAAPAPAVSIPLNVPKEVNVNFHLNLKFEADPALAALLQRAPAAEPAPVKAAPPAPSHVAPSHVAPSRVEPPAPARGAVSPWLLVALCVLVSVSTVFALGPLGQAASSLGLSDLPRLAAPVFTLAALTVGYLWGRGRGSDRQR
ncbi:MAG: hypothetical protein JXB05_16020, partial [Myxococcaceae bacterium]|nr:hypothetical protein [Myxococcaceae bacterium]